MSLYFDVTGVIVTDALFVVASIVKCPNLNADLLGGTSSAALEQNLFAFDVYSVFYTDIEATANADKASYLVTHNCTITKLKIKQEGVATANADTTVEFFKNAVSIGSVTVSGNVTTVQTTDIADVPCVVGDIITTSVTLHDGTTSHNNITAQAHFKQKFVNQ